MEESLGIRNYPHSQSMRIYGGRVGGFPILEGKFYKRKKYDIYLRDSGGKGGKDFGSRFSWYHGITIHLGKLTLGKVSWLQG